MTFVVQFNEMTSSYHVWSFYHCGISQKSRISLVVVINFLHLSSWCIFLFLFSGMIFFIIETQLWVYYVVDVIRFMTLNHFQFPIVTQRYQHTTLPLAPAPHAQRPVMALLTAGARLVKFPGVLRRVAGGDF